MQFKGNKIFLLLSLLILIIDILFVTINRSASNNSLQESMEKQSQTIHKSFDLTLSLVYENMLQLASFISSDDEVQRLFRLGKWQL